MKQDYLIKTVFENFMKWDLKVGISIDADSGPPTGMYFDAVVVFVTSQTLLFRLALAILWFDKFFFIILPSIRLLASFVVMFGFGWGNHFDSAVAHWEVCCSCKKESDDYTSKSGG